MNDDFDYACYKCGYGLGMCSCSRPEEDGKIRRHRFCGGIMDGNKCRECKKEVK